MKLTTPIIIVLIVAALVGIYYFQVWSELNDFVDDGLGTGTDPTADYPDGWNMPGNPNYIVIDKLSDTSFKISYYVHNMTSTNGVVSGAPAYCINYVNQAHNNGWMIEAQRSCGVSQLEALGVI